MAFVEQCFVQSFIHILHTLYIHIQLIGLVGRMLANVPGDRVSIRGRDIPKTQKMVLDTSLLNTKYYKIHIKGKVEQCRERCSTRPNITVL